MKMIFMSKFFFVVLFFLANVCGLLATTIRNALSEKISLYIYVKMPSGRRMTLRVPDLGRNELETTLMGFIPSKKRNPVSSIPTDNLYMLPSEVVDIGLLNVCIERYLLYVHNTDTYYWADIANWEVVESFIKASTHCNPQELIVEKRGETYYLVCKDGSVEFAFAPTDKYVRFSTFCGFPSCWSALSAGGGFAF